MSDTAGVMSSYHGTMTDLKESNTDLPHVAEDSIFCKADNIPSLEKKRASTTSHLVEEFLIVPSMDDIRFGNVMPFESQIDHTSHGAEKLFSNVDSFENKAFESLVQYCVSEEGEPYNVKQHFHRGDITGTSDTAGVKFSDGNVPDFKGSSISLSCTLEANISKDADQPNLPKERASATPHVVEEIINVCSRDEVRTSKFMPCESEIHRSSHSVEKLFSHMDASESIACQSIGHPDGFNEDNIVFKDADIPSLSNEQASTTSHIVEEIPSACSKDEVRPVNFAPFDSGFHHTFQCGVDSFENKASESLCHHEGSEEGEEPYDAKDRRVVTSISDTSGVESRCDENMPEFEGLGIDLPYEEDNIVFNDADIPSLAKERAFALEQLRQSSILLTQRPKSSIMNIMDMISDVSNSSPLGILQKMDLDFSLEHNNPVIEQFTSTSSIKLMGMFCNNGSQLDGPVFESSHSLSSLSAMFGSELQSLPLTPPAIKFSHVRLSGKKSSSSVKVSSNPELVCFRIDENSSTTEENADVVQVGYSTQRPSRNIEVLTNSKPLSDVTSLYQNGTCLLSNSKEFLVRDSLESVNSDAASSLGFEYPEREYNLKNKENHRYTDAIKELGKSTKTVTKRSERPRISCRYSDKIRKNQNILKGCKQSNILSNISSFIPQIQQKQRQALPLQKKKDIKVKALEAAEAAKRLEDQMKLEREKRKAAVKLEREKLRQENTKRLKFEQKQKAEEGRKKENIAARKRHREAEERKVKDRKRQCIGETRTLQRQHRDKLHCGKAKKDNQQKTIDEDQKGGKQRNNGGQKKLESVVDVMESQMAVEMQQCTIELVSADTIRGDDKIKVLVASAERTSFEKGVGGSNFLQETVEDTVCAAHISFELQSYEMSPYQTSDEEDMEEDSRHRKYIPKWARGESLVESIVSNQQLDPKDIFSRKRSFNISQEKKKDIKVKALEAAEAAKRLEDQMKLEREKRKAAVKLEREKLRQENTKRLKFEQKQKAEEGRKKENIATRKRHREAEERKVKDRKRQCIGETRTLQRQHRDKLHCGKAKKDNQQKTIDEEQKGGKQRNNGGQKKLESAVDVMESQMAVEMQQCTIELVSADTIRGDDKIKVLVASAERTSFEKGVGGSIFLRETVEETVCAAQISFELQSYEMSPYQTSDEEDMKEDSRHRKYIPKWARGESLAKSIVSNQQLDPKDIFSRKRSFSIPQVLPT
ncbi:uncharacterized protein LOC110030288 [Phalaenopsis equestris]|uniref:uncharacterized protein LOC110030288 n=1 Tax=Phalaenopsis equestris TaxID=78828 RepID=UPI0009E51CFC|nr:uncharacterized protein LOC110030288 [Phalaenopsis equestris]